MHYTGYDDCPDVIDSFVDQSDVTNELKETINIVYQVGNPDVDPYSAVVDTACPKTVSGIKFIDSYAQSKGNIILKRKYEDKNFKFGDSKVFTSKVSYEIEVEIGSLEEIINVSTVDADIPLLLGTDYQSEWGIVILKKRELTIKKTGETFK